MKRWHDDFKKTNRTWNIHHQAHVDSNKISTSQRIGKSPYEVDCICDVQKGRFRKINPHCNKTGCGICRGHKIPKRRLTVKEIKSEREFKEQLKDM